MRPVLTSALLALSIAAFPALSSAFAEEQAQPPAALSVPSSSKPAPDAGTISKVVVQGNRRVETEAIRAGLPLKPGDAYDHTKLRQALQALWRLNYFDDLQFDLSQGAGGITLTVLVAEKPSVHDIKFEGLEELGKDDFKDIIEVRAYQILDAEKVRKTARAIQQKYVEKGFFLAEVTPRFDKRPNNEIDVIFVVNEHAKVTVKEIRFVGNKNITDEELKPVMATQEGGPFSFLSGAGNYREDILLQRDLILLQGVYFDRGYLFVKMGKPTIEITPDKRFVFITFTVEEGEAYNVGKVEVSGDMLPDLAREDLFKRVRLKQGAVFNRSILLKDLEGLGDVYKDRGYAYANVTPLTEPHPDNKTVDVNYSFQKGDLVSIEKIEVVGNSKTRDRVIRRELKIREGDLYSATAIKVSKQRVTALGFFESVEINSRRGSTDDKMVLEVSIKEKLTGTIQVGFGFTGGESFFGQAQLSQDNLFGYGHTASLGLQLSSIRQLFSFSYFDPYLFDTKWTGSIELYRSDLFYNNFTRRATGGSLTGGYELGDLNRYQSKFDFEDFRFFVTYTLENVTLDTSSNPTAQLLHNLYTSGRTSSVRFSFNYDKRDNRLFPTNGHLESASAEYATSLLGSQNLFQRFRVTERRYYPLIWGLVAKMKIDLAYIRATDPVDHPISIGERFQEGGINSIRGYNLRSISPTARIASQRSPDAGTQDIPVGGNKELVTNWELEFPIVESAGVRGVLFYDAGNAFAEDEKLFSSRQRDGTLPLGLFHSVGAGVRWFSPLGPLRFETGFPLTRRANDDSYLFEFTVGNFF